MNVNDIIISRRTIHKFTKDKVSDQFIREAINVANYAPCHRLTFPWRYSNLGVLSRKKIADLFIKLSSIENSVSDKMKESINSKILGPSHLIVASQILKGDLTIQKEDYAACACSIQNLAISLAAHGVGLKWSTKKYNTNEETYSILEIDKEVEEIIGFLYIGYGETPSRVDRPSLPSIYREF